MVRLAADRLEDAEADRWIASGTNKRIELGPLRKQILQSFNLGAC